MRAGIQRDLMRQFSVVVLTLLVVAAATQFSHHREVENKVWEAHAYSIVEQAERTLSLVKDAERGQRGYLLAGKAEYLIPYDAAASSLPREIDRLAALTRDNPDQQANVRGLKALVLAKLAELRETVELRRAGNAEAALAVVLTDRGRRLMDEIRGAAGVIKEGESSLLARRSTQVERARLGASLTSWCGTALGLFTLVFAFRQVAGELVRRKEAEGRLRESQETLKEQIQSTRDLNFKLERANTQLAEKALCDELTGLKNRRSFDEDMGRSISRAQRQGEPFSLAVVGVDDFEGFNNAHGRPAGDDLLRAVAATLLESVRAGDVVGRYGGGGFLIALHAAGRSAGREAGERLRGTVARRDWPLGNVTVSVGVATLDDDVIGSGALLEQADWAHLGAKQRGGDQVSHFDDDPPALCVANPTPVTHKSTALAEG